MLRTILYYGLYILYRLLNFLIFVYCILSWFARSNYKIYNIYMWLGRFLEPLFVPVRKLMYRFNINLPVDLSPWITMLLLGLVYRVLVSLLFGMFPTRI